MRKINYSYSVAIRTLGKAGDKYQTLLDSLACQTIPPEDIYVFIAEGYSKPKESIGVEKYVYVPKGMLTQRALQYEQIQSEYILFLDDDLFLPSNAVERMFELLCKNNADVISPDIFDNSSRVWYSEISMFIAGRMRPRYKDNQWGYKVMCNGGYSYNKMPVNEVYESQTNAGACFLCKKIVFLSVCLSEELWVDKMQYPLGEDQITYYKMYKYGFKVLTYYNHGIKHLDAGCNMNKDRELARIYSDLYFKIVFWHRFIFLPEERNLLKIIDMVALLYTLIFSLLISILRLRFDILNIKYCAICAAIKFIRGAEYKSLTRI